LPIRTAQPTKNGKIPKLSDSPAAAKKYIAIPVFGLIMPFSCVYGAAYRTRDKDTENTNME
jgi:hypothetical protein